MPQYNPITQVHLTPLQPGGQPSIAFGLLGDATMTPVTGGTGGWQIVDRPRKTAATQWYDRSPWQLELPLIIDSAVIFGGVLDQDVEPYCIAVESWSDPVPGTLLPPIIQTQGPIPGNGRRWVVYSVEWQEAVRRNTQDGARTQQKLKMTLYEYIPPLATITNTSLASSPASQAQSAQVASTTTSTGGNSYSTYVVMSGDTLSGIAAKLLGNYARWPEIVALNPFIHDPNFIQVGWVLKIPSR